MEGRKAVEMAREGRGGGGSDCLNHGFSRIKRITRIEVG